MDYTLIRSDRKSFALQVRGGEVIVRAPRFASKRQADRFVAANEEWIRKQLAKPVRPIDTEPTEEERRALQKRARELIPARVAHYGELMGLTPAGISITSARTRFGSCSSKGRLSFSWRLMLYPDDAIDYVVVHELAHLRHMDHSPAFYALVERYLPDWKRRRRLLKG